MGEPLLLQLFVASSIPVCKILLICAIGAFCARKGLLTPEGRRVLGALSFLVFNPSLIFVKLASTLTPSRLLHWWPLVLNTGISTAVGLGLGYLGVRLVRPPHALRPHTIVAIALGNLGNLPLVIVSSLAASSAEVLHGIPAGRAQDLAVSYVMVGLLIPVIAHATIGFSMLRKPNTLELPDPSPAGEGPDGDAVLQTPRTAGRTVVAAVAAAAAAAAAASGPDTGPSAAAVARSGSQGDHGSVDDGSVVVLDPAARQEKRPLLAGHLHGHSSAGWHGTGWGGEGGGGGGEGGGAGGQELYSGWSDARAGDGSDGVSIHARSCRHRPHRASASGAAATPLPPLPPPSLPSARRSASGGFPSEGDLHGKLQNLQPHASPPRLSQDPSFHYWRPSASGCGGGCQPDSPPLQGQSHIKSGSGVPAGLSAQSVPLYGCAVDCLGQSDVDPLLPPPPPAHPLQPTRAASCGWEAGAGDDSGCAAVQQGSKGLGVGGGGAAEAEESVAAAAALPPLEGARLVPDRSGFSSADLLRSSSGRRTLGRLARSTSGRRLLFEWHSRLDYRALGRQVVREVTSPPLAAILLSIPVGCVRPLQEAFFGSPEAGGTEAAPLGLLTSCLAMLGDCTIPSILLILGATLSNGPGAARVPLRVISLVNVTRLALLPLLGLALVMGTYAARVFEAPDPIYLLVLLIQNTAPTAIMVHTMASVHANRSEEVSSILFWGYIVSIAVVPLWLTLFLFVVKQMFRYQDGGAGVPVDGA